MWVINITPKKGGKRGLKCYKAKSMWMSAINVSQHKKLGNVGDQYYMAKKVGYVDDQHYTEKNSLEMWLINITKQRKLRNMDYNITQQKKLGNFCDQ